MTPINRCLNKELTIYGMKVIALIIAAITGLIVLVKFNLTAGILSLPIGYSFGLPVSKWVHSGSLQRFVQWNLPLRGVVKAKLPPSYLRKFF